MFWASLASPSFFVILKLHIAVIQFFETRFVFSCFHQNSELFFSKKVKHVLISSKFYENLIFLMINHIFVGFWLAHNSRYFRPLTHSRYFSKGFIGIKCEPIYNIIAMMVIINSPWKKVFTGCKNVNFEKVTNIFFRKIMRTQVYL